jgi:hypothetical protein
MLQSINKLYDDKIGALDGDVGHVEDMYFDDRSWAVRYLGPTPDPGWLAGRCSSPRMPFVAWTASASAWSCI